MSGLTAPLLCWRMRVSFPGRRTINRQFIIRGSRSIVLSDHFGIMSGRKSDAKVFLTLDWCSHYARSAVHEVMVFECLGTTQLVNVASWLFECIVATLSKPKSVTFRTAGLCVCRLPLTFSSPLVFQGWPKCPRWSRRGSRSWRTKNTGKCWSAPWTLSKSCCLFLFQVCRCVPVWATDRSLSI